MKCSKDKGERGVDFYLRDEGFGKFRYRFQIGISMRTYT